MSRRGLNRGVGQFESPGGAAAIWGGPELQDLPDVDANVQSDVDYWEARMKVSQDNRMPQCAMVVPAASSSDTRCPGGGS